jgi:hypothetical protein
MKNYVFVVLAAFLLMAMAGCTRSYITTKERVDIDVAGNQGVIYGPAPSPHKVANPTREIYSIDIELPSAQAAKSTGKAAPKKEKSK